MGQLPSLRFSLASPTAALWLGLVVLAVAACPHETTVVDPTPPDTTNGGGGGGGGGTVQRATLTVMVTMTGQDSVLAELIGSAGGRLSEAEVTIARIGSEGSERKDTTGADGAATFSGLLGGSYSVSAIRLLTGAEIAQLGASNADVNAFGGGATIAVVVPATQQALPAVAARRGSLVISEVFPHIPLIGTQAYYFAQFLEVYNNTDTTIYLDGKTIGLGPPFLRDVAPDYRCDDTAGWQLDPEGLWTQYFERFPGTGRDYGLSPGRAAVVAMDAIDHRVSLSWLPDLSGVSFELIGPNDVDNPNVPNMERLGAEFTIVLGHGMRFDYPGILFIAGPVEVATLPTTTIVGFAQPFYRIPRDRVLDVVMFTPTPAIEPVFTSPLCPQLSHEAFDTQPAALRDFAAQYSIARRLLSTLPDARVLLQRTRNSGRDLEARFPHTPMTVP